VGETPLHLRQKERQMYQEYRVKNVALGTELKNKFGARTQADGTIAKNRLIEEDASNDIIAGTLDSVRSFAANQSAGRVDEDYFLAETGLVNLTAGTDMVAGQRFKCGTAGKAIAFLDSVLIDTTIATQVGVPFTNQPATDTVDVESSSALDVTQTVTLYGTDSADAYITETLTLTGTSAVSTASALWKAVCGIELSAACVGTMTVTENSGGLTIKAVTIGDTSASIIAVTDGYSYNKKAEIKASGASTGQIVSFIEATDGATASGLAIQINGATEVLYGTVSYKVTNLMVGNVAADRTLTLATSSTEDDIKLAVGKVIKGADAGDEIIGLI